MRGLRLFFSGTLRAFVMAPVLAATPFLHLASPPLPVQPGQEFTLCAANVGRHKAQVTLRFVNVRTGAIVSEKSLLLRVPGDQTTLADPCLSTSAAAIAAAGARPAPWVQALPSSAQPLVVGTVIVNRVTHS